MFNKSNKYSKEYQDTELEDEVLSGIYQKENTALPCDEMSYNSSLVDKWEEFIYPGYGHFDRIVYIGNDVYIIEE